MFSRWRTTLAGLSFLGLTAAISVNALYLQHGGSRLPVEARVKDAEPIEATPPTAALKPVTGSLQGAGAQSRPSPPPPAKEAARPLAVGVETIKAVQRELARRGYSVGAEDGRIRMITREAIIAYEFDRGLALTGEASEALLKDMLFAPVTPRAERKLDARRYEVSQPMVARVQEVLSSLGFGPGAMSGQMDAATRAALRQFQSHRKLAATGELSERVLLEMSVVTGKPLVSSP
ncbi:MAG: peptidoglycan-binding protein [Hyphomicrobiales bacterium]|nr:peptidoglycan-binding protein [Hyphomicrobiales bacterium]